MSVIIRTFTAPQFEFVFMSSVDKPEAAAQTFSDFSKHIHILFNIDANKDDLI